MVIVPPLNVNRSVSSTTLHGASKAGEKSTTNVASRVPGVVERLLLASPVVVTSHKKGFTRSVQENDVNVKYQA